MELLTAPKAVMDELDALIVSIRRHNYTIPEHVHPHLEKIAAKHESDGVTLQQVIDVFKLQLEAADDPAAPAKIPTLVRREYLSS
jgi:hypothetical protein